MITLIDVIATFLIRAVIGALRYLPDRLAYPLARGTVGAFLICMPRTKPVALRNLELAFPERTPDERRRIYRESLNVLARNLIGFARIPDLTLDEANRAIDVDRFHALVLEVRKRNPKLGVIVATAHYGSFESAAQLLTLIYGPWRILIRPFGLPRLDAFWTRRRELHGSQIFSRKGAYRELISAVESGSSIGILIDQNVKANHAVFVDLFGIKAATSKSVALAALRTGCGIVFAVGVSEAIGKIRFYVHEIDTLQNDPRSAEEKVVAITAQLNHSIEEVVRAHPEQWFWIHRRFKTRPPGDSQSIY